MQDESSSAVFFFSGREMLKNFKCKYLVGKLKCERHRWNSTESSSEAARFYFSAQSESPQPCMPGVKQIDIMAHHVAALHCVRSTLLTPATITSFLPLSPLYLILLTFLFILKPGLCFRSLISGCFFPPPPCSYYPLLHGCPQEELEGGAWQTGHEHRVEKDADVKAMNLGTLPPPRPPSLSFSSLHSLFRCGTVPCTTQSVLTCVSQDNHS